MLSALYMLSFSENVVYKITNSLLTPQNAILGIVEDESYETNDIKLINYILMTFKHSLYNRREIPTPLNFLYVRERLKLVQKIEYKIAKDRNTLGLHF